VSIESDYISHLVRARFALPVTQRRASFYLRNILSLIFKLPIRITLLINKTKRKG